MADFAQWVTAAEGTLGWKPGTFMAAYERNQDQAHATAIEGTVIGPLILELVENDDWDGSATELLERLHILADQLGRHLPSTPSALSNRLKRLAPNLRKFGIRVEFVRTGHEGLRTIHITKDREKSVSSDSAAA